MPFDIQILGNKIDKIKEAFQNGNFSNALVGALNVGNGLMQQRIFQNNEDIEGNSFGSYVGKKRKARLIRSLNKTQDKRNKSIVGQYLTAYERKRLKAGRQIQRKDLEFSGGLRRSIENKVESEKAVVLEFNNDLAAKIARGQEQQIGRIRGSGTVSIFKLNASEKEKVNEQGLVLIKEIIDRK